MFAKKHALGMTLIEVVLSIALITIVFGISAVPVLFVFKKMGTSDEVNQLELIGTKIQTISVRMFTENNTVGTTTGSITVSRNAFQYPITATSPCVAFTETFEYGASLHDRVIECGKHNMEISTSGKIHTVFRTIDE